MLFIAHEIRSIVKQLHGVNAVQIYDIDDKQAPNIDYENRILLKYKKHLKLIIRHHRKKFLSV